MANSAAFSKTYTIGILESIGSGGVIKPDVLKVWEPAIKYINNKNSDQFTVKLFADVSKLNEAINKKEVDFSYAQSPGMVCTLLLANPDIKVVSTLLTKDIPTQKLLPYYYVYLFTTKSGLNIVDVKNMHAALKNQKVAIVRINTKIFKPIQKILKDDNVRFIEKEKYYSAIDDVLDGKIDALFALDRVHQYLSQAKKNKLVFIPVLRRPNGALLANKNIESSVIADLTERLKNLPRSDLDEIHVKGFSTSLGEQAYLNIDNFDDALIK